MLLQFPVSAEQAPPKPRGSASQPLLLPRSPVPQESREDSAGCCFGPGGVGRVSRWCSAGLVWRVGLLSARGLRASSWEAVLSYAFIFLSAVFRPRHVVSPARRLDFLCGGSGTPGAVVLRQEMEAAWPSGPGPGQAAPEPSPIQGGQRHRMFEAAP